MKNGERIAWISEIEPGVINTKTCVADAVDAASKHFTGHGIEPGEYQAILETMESRINHAGGLDADVPSESIWDASEPSLSTFFDELDARNITATTLYSSADALAALRVAKYIKSEGTNFVEVGSEGAEPKYPIAILAADVDAAGYGSKAHIWFSEDEGDTAARWDYEMQGRDVLLVADLDRKHSK